MFVCVTREKFGVGRDIDAQSMVLVFLTEKNGETASGRGEDNGAGILSTERRAHYCWHLGYTSVYLV